MSCSEPDATFQIPYRAWIVRLACKACWLLITKLVGGHENLDQNSWNSREAVIALSGLGLLHAGHGVPEEPFLFAASKAY